jgi:PPP family 3-phenylpropionic acid transporter
MLRTRPRPLPAARSGCIIRPGRSDLIEVFYFFYYQSVGIYMTFMPAYLRGLGLSGRQISTVFALAPLFSLVVPLAWAYLADRTHRHDRVLRIVIGGAWLGFTPMLFAGTFTAILTSWGLYALFAVAVGGLADAFAVARVRAGAVYGRLRLWGSVGYVVAAVAVGAVLSLRGRAADRLVPVTMWITLGCAFFAATRLRGEGDPAARPRPADVLALLREPKLRLLLAIAAMHWICLTPYNVYFGVFLRDIGLPPVSWSFAYSTGVVVEVLVLMTFHRLSARFRLPTLLAAAFAVSAARWLAIGVVRAPWALIALQALHGMSFGMFWSAAIALVATTVPASLRATGQALLIMAINVGAAVGSAITGRVYDAHGAPLLFLLAAIGELAPLAVVIAARRRLQDPGALISSPP